MKKWMTKKMQGFFAQNKDLVVLEPAEDLEELFLQMEDSVKRTEHILIKNPAKKRSVEQCVNAFIEKYKVLIRTVERSYEGQYETRISLKAREQDAAGHYKDIQKEYDEDYYLQDCGGYAEFQKFHGKRLDQRLTNMMYLVAPKEGDRILDLGCGRGELTYMLSRYASKTVGIDYSEAAVAIAKKNFGKYQNEQNLSYQCGDIMQLDPKETYNKIVMADVYEHIEAEVMEKLLEKTARLLTEDGVLYIHMAPNLDYYEKVYAKQVQAVNSGGFLPANPRSRYEERMHINEQRPLDLKRTLLRYFPSVYVWSGSIEMEEQLMDILKQQIENEVNAVAGKQIFVQKLFAQVTSARLEKAAAGVQIVCEEGCIKTDGR